MERLLDEISFVDADYVRERLNPILQD